MTIHFIILPSLFQPVKHLRYIHVFVIHSSRFKQSRGSHLVLSTCHTFMIYLPNVTRHEHLHLACVLLVGRDLARCLVYGRFVSCPIYYATPYLLHLYSLNASSSDTVVRCWVSRTELFSDASALPVSILDAYAF